MIVPLKRIRMFDLKSGIQLSVQHLFKKSPKVFVDYLNLKV